MPTRSLRHHILADLDYLIKVEVSDTPVNSDSREDSSNAVEELLVIRNGIGGSRYLAPRAYVKQKRTMADMLYSYDEKGFKAEVRMDKASFRQIVNILGRHPVFHNKSRNKQTPVWIQCYVAFRRLGSYGNANSLIRNGHNAGFSEGCVVKFMDRVITAILSLRKQYIYWPDADERARIRSRFQKIEHVNGVLKGRWASLKGLPIQVKRKEDMVKVNRHIIACLILYNILIDLKDDWEEDEEIPVDENDRDVLFAAENGETEDAAKQLRILVQNSCLNWFYSH